MVDLERYYNEGWGLSKHGFEKLAEILDMIDTNSNVVEFGSGISTKFFIDYKNHVKNINIFSYENDKKYGYQGDKSNINFIYTDLMVCSDKDFESQFVLKKYDRNCFIKQMCAPSTRQKNVFYDVGDELPENIQLVLLDGPNGNGRSLSFLHLQNKMNENSYIFVDDYNHYPFLDYCQKIFNYQIIYEYNGDKSNKKWKNGGNFAILKIE